MGGFRPLCGALDSVDQDGSAPISAGYKDAFSFMNAKSDEETGRIGLDDLEDVQHFYNFMLLLSIIFAWLSIVCLFYACEKGDINVDADKNYYCCSRVFGCVCCWGNPVGKALCGSNKFCFSFRRLQMWSPPDAPVVK